jgi:cold shock CspA family protein
MREYRLPEGPREFRTIVAWNGGMGIGRIQTDRGDRLDIFYWSILQGFRKLTVGQRVEFRACRRSANATSRRSLCQRKRIERM